MSRTTFKPDRAPSDHMAKILFLRRNAELRRTISEPTAILPHPRARTDSMFKTTIRPKVLLDEIEFLAWVVQANPGDRLEYHRGFIVLDTDKQMSDLPEDKRRVLRALADAALRAAMKDLVHLVQARLSNHRFAYIAIARPKPPLPRSASIARQLEAA